MNIGDEIDRLFKGTQDNFIYFQKQYERWLITNIFSLAKKTEKFFLKRRNLKAIRLEAQNTKLVLSKIVKELDSSIQGEFSNKVVETLETKSAEYDSFGS